MACLTFFPSMVWVVNQTTSEWRITMIAHPILVAGGDDFSKRPSAIGMDKCAKICVSFLVTFFNLLCLYSCPHILMKRLDDSHTLKSVVGLSCRRVVRPYSRPQSSWVGESYQNPNKIWKQRWIGAYR